MIKQLAFACGLPDWYAGGGRNDLRKDVLTGPSIALFQKAMVRFGCSRTAVIAGQKGEAGCREMSAAIQDAHCAGWRMDGRRKGWAVRIERARHFAQWPALKWHWTRETSIKRLVRSFL